MNDQRNESATHQMLNLVLVVVGVFGFVLLLYGFSCDITGEKLAWLERVANPISALLTVLGVLITVGSIYLKPNPRDAATSSTHLAGPVIIGFGVVIIAYWIWGWKHGTTPNDYILQGYAIIGLSTACIRTFVTAL